MLRQSIQKTGSLLDWRPSLTRASGQDDRRLEIGLFILWFGTVLLLSANHDLWRDEVRALTIALQGDTLWAGFRALRGEGHPALWYLVLRGLHAVTGSRLVLPFASLGIASVTGLLVVLYAPFSRLVIALLLFGGLLLFEYSVMERNYGISVLLMWLIAIRYPKDRDGGGVWLGVLLFLLANTNAHSVVLAGAFLLFWMLDLAHVHRPGFGRPWRGFVLNAGIATLGVALCAVTIYPPYNDAALSDGIPGSLPAVVGRVLMPGWSFGALIDDTPFRLRASPQWLLASMQTALTVLLYGSVLGVLRLPGAAVAGWAALLGLSAFFTLIYGGSYRHEGLWLAFMVGLYWIACAREARVAAGPAPPKPALVRLGSGAMLLLLALQLPAGMRPLAGMLLNHPPRSRARDFGSLIAARPELGGAIVIAQSDSNVETLPYYAPNPTYMTRLAQVGSVVKYGRSVREDLSLADLLATAQRLAAERNTPVLILMDETLDPAHPARVEDDGYGGVFRITPEQVRAFLAATTLIKHFDPALTDESYDVYLLNGSQR